MKHSEEKLEYRGPGGADITAEVVHRHPDPDPGHLPAGVDAEIVRVHVDGDLIDLHRLTVVSEKHADPAVRAQAYAQLDAELLAGIRLLRRGHPVPGPRSLSRLVGRERPDSLPFVLLAARRGVPVAEAAGNLLREEESHFTAALLGAYRWMTAAGLSHRALTAHSVRWDSTTRTVQMEHFFASGLIDTPRPRPAGLISLPPNVNPDAPAGWILDRDDARAVAELLFLALTGRRASNPELARRPDLDQALENAFHPDPRQRPTPRDLLERFRVPEPLGPPPNNDMGEGMADFERERLRKHPAAVGAAAAEPHRASPSGGRGFFRRRGRLEHDRSQ
ncbi:hypothetical protein [Kineosporia babensis]|uniref:Protein kinase domain-containing protein n=1 Tax=Kineosporia babensis TaxID=499548 RepID=A0A9X1STL9_9ACTN|nr:hypothetical protein [Kineosporia babensis]MCD5312054.1 hypothetical protein [Kineosporia babensis]